MQTRSVSITGPGDSPWIRLDTWAGGQVGFQTAVTGTVAYTVYTTFDDTDDPFNPVASPVWDSILTGVDGAFTGTSGSIQVIPTFIKATINTGTGTVRLTVTQSLNAPL